MDVNQYLKLRNEYVSGVSCNCSKAKLIEELDEQFNVCPFCKKAVATEAIKEVRGCLDCSAKRYPLFKGQKVTIENLEGVVVEVECGSHFIVDINGTKKWFNWWKNYYDVQMRAVS